eukprot:4716958-Pleurochrysis_carterae.AAC.1
MTLASTGAFEDPHTQVVPRSPVVSGEPWQRARELRDDAWRCAARLCAAPPRRRRVQHDLEHALCVARHHHLRWREKSRRCNCESRGLIYLKAVCVGHQLLLERATHGRMFAFQNCCHEELLRAQGSSCVLSQIDGVVRGFKMGLSLNVGTKAFQGSAKQCLFQACIQYALSPAWPAKRQALQCTHRA